MFNIVVDMPYTTAAVMIGVAGASAFWTGGDPIKSVASSLISGAAVQTIRHPMRTTNFVAPKGGIVRSLGGKLARDVWHIGKAFAGTTTGGVLIGYTAGAAIGTAVVTYEFGWDPEGEMMGGKDALGFYTFGLVGGEAATVEGLLNTAEFAPRTKYGKHLQYIPNISWLWSKENIAYV